MLTTQLEFAKRVARGTHRRIQTSLIKQALCRRGLAGVYNIPTFTVQEELETLFDLARACSPNARVLEVGSYLGASTCFLAAGLRGNCASIVCIDTWQNQTMSDGIRDTFEEFKKNVNAVRQQLTLIRKFSSDVVPEELGGQFDLVFLDGDHSYRQAHADFELVSNLVAANGVLAFHDSQFFEGVSRVIGEALESAKWQIGGSVRNLLWVRRAQFSH
ncbi:MAG TPA: class I SAM-dependent methyltransferase [Verrucomicrobiae bacterium]|jgi:predicted O-methyltransferase YrrM|nr:class I SAM-dependent methyltransferase [Verrucomicrobiae bacterium]